MRRATLLAALLLVGCTGSRSIVDLPPYPAHLPRPETIDVQVYRDGTHIELTNTTARNFGPSTLWLNGWYARDLPEGLAVGDSLRLPLNSFIDRYAEPFRAGGFWATQTPDRLILAELETHDPQGRPVLLGLVVVVSEAP